MIFCSGRFKPFHRYNLSDVTQSLLTLNITWVFFIVVGEARFCRQRKREICLRGALSGECLAAESANKQAIACMCVCVLVDVVGIGGGRRIRFVCARLIGRRERGHVTSGARGHVMYLGMTVCSQLQSAGGVWTMVGSFSALLLLVVNVAVTLAAADADSQHRDTAPAADVHHPDDR